MEVRILHYLDQSRSQEDTSNNDLLLDDQTSIENLSLDSTDDTSSVNDTTNSNTNIYTPDSYTITATENTLHIEFTTSMFNRINSAFIDIIIPVGEDKVIDVTARESEMPLELAYYEAFNFVERLTNIANVRHSGKKIARIVSSAGSDVVYVLLCSAHPDIPGFSNEIISKETSTTHVLISKAPWIETRLNLIRKKSKLINVIDYYRSLAYLEAQVDVLTRVILSLITSPTELSNLLNLADKNSVLNIKPIQDIARELTDSKFSLRKQQELYYERLTLDD